MSVVILTGIVFGHERKDCGSWYVCLDTLREALPLKFKDGPCSEARPWIEHVPGLTQSLSIRRDSGTRALHANRIKKSSLLDEGWVYAVVKPLKGIEIRNERSPIPSHFVWTIRHRRGGPKPDLARPQWQLR